MLALPAHDTPFTGAGEQAASCQLNTPGSRHRQSVLLAFMDQETPRLDIGATAVHEARTKLPSSHALRLLLEWRTLPEENRSKI